MPHYSVATTKDKLSSLIERARAGEEVVITNRGKPQAEIVPPRAQARPDVAAATRRLRERVRDLPKLQVPADKLRDWLYEDYEY